MSLRFCFGGSGAGKSTQVYKEIISRSMEDSKCNFLIIVPDQFTMQTQKELVTLHERGGIMNIDVLSFGRLSHRIFEEVGENTIPVLDDTGKSLVLRKVAADLEDKLTVLNGNLEKQGYIHEIKSTISEFMQYGIGTEDVSKLIAFSEKKGVLVNKLKDLEILYKGFVDYIRGQFVTTEETLGLLQKALHRSEIIKNSVVVFDGFTGFTPIQNKLIQELMQLSKEVIVTVTIDEKESPFEMGGEQNLFYLSQKTTNDLCKLAKEANIPRGEDRFLTMGGEKTRFAANEAMAHLEKHLFRYPLKAFTEGQDCIKIFAASSPKEEVRQASIQMEKLVREEGLCYRDIAVVAGNLEAYAEHVETEFGIMGIPCYIDRTRGIVLNPFIEFIKSALRVLENNFSYESVFQYLRSGLAEFTFEEVDMLENYIIQTGIRGRKKWERLFVYKTKEMGEEVEPLNQINRLRERLVNQLSPLLVLGKNEEVHKFVKALYEFLTISNTAGEMAKYEKLFEENQDIAKAKEYGQLYRLVMELLDQVIGLLGNETMSLVEFADILEAGFGEIEVGTIPQNVDRVLVGDIERTRLKEVKVLFFLGVNDGNIPKNGGKGGIISDIDREFLRQSELELSPSPRQQMYIQRLYLYLNMTKPSEKLYVSFSKVSGEGKTLRPAYLIETLQKIYPDIEVYYPEQAALKEQIMTPLGGIKYMAESLRSYARGEESSKDFMFSLYDAYVESKQFAPWMEMLTEAAFYQYEKRGLGKDVAHALYGKILESSVSRLETYAACAYSHFLQYGLSLKERQAFGFETVDLGNVFHGVLEIFAQKLEESDYNWFNFPADFGTKTVAMAVESMAAEYGDTILYSSARNEYAIGRIERILNRTVSTIQYQLQKGTFTPESYELSFAYVSDFDSVNIALSEEEKIRLRGRIDRIDTCEDENRIYVKVVDYKSGNHHFDLVAMYYGLQLQLVLYMNAALEMEKKKNPDKEVVPAALLYYHVADPAIEVKEELDTEELNAKLIESLRTNGIINGNEQIVHRLDTQLEQSSDVIPVERKKDGSFSARSSVLSGEELQTISSYVNKKVKEIGKEILAGDIEVNPYASGSREACTYCSYQNICGFDPTISGYKKRKLQEIGKDEIMQVINQAVEVEKNGN